MRWVLLVHKLSCHELLLLIKHLDFRIFLLCFLKLANHLLLFLKYNLFFFVPTTFLTCFLKPDITPGNCWAFSGSQGHVTIKLIEPIIPESFTLEHIDFHVSYNTKTAPKKFSVWVTSPNHYSIFSFFFLLSGIT